MASLDRVVLPLRVLLVLLLAGLVVGQVLSIPGQFAHLAEEEPDLAHLRWPLTAFFVLEVLALQVVVVCTWRLLTMVRADRIFSDEAFAWVDGIVAAVGAGWVLYAAGALWVLTQADDPGTGILLIWLGLVGGVVTLVVVVLRALLHQAAALRSELEAVI